MLTLRTTESFEWPVPVQRPHKDGTFMVEEFTAIFEAVPADEFVALMEARDDAVLLSRVWTGWDGVQDADGAMVLFSTELRDRLLQDLAIRRAAARAYAEAMTGQEYRRKN